MKKYRIFKNGKLILTARFYSVKHVEKFLQKSYSAGTYEVQELSVYKEFEIHTVEIKEKN